MFLYKYRHSLAAYLLKREATKSLLDKNLNRFEGLNAT